MRLEVLTDGCRCPSPPMAFWQPSDEKLMARVQANGDEAAFTELFRRWQGPIRQACQRILNDQSRSEELTQEAFTRLYLKRDQFKKGARFSSYFWRVAINLCRDELRRLRTRLTVVDPPLAAPGAEPLNHQMPLVPDPAAIADQSERAQAVRSSLMALPENVRIVVVMRHFHDLKFREIAETLEIPEGTVKTRMAQGLNLLAKQLQHDLEIHPERKDTSPPISLNS